MAQAGWRQERALRRAKRETEGEESLSPAMLHLAQFDPWINDVARRQGHVIKCSRLHDHRYNDNKKGEGQP